MRIILLIALALGLFILGVALIVDEEVPVLQSGMVLIEEKPAVVEQVFKKVPTDEKYRITEMEDGSYIIQEKDAFGFWGSNPGAEYYWIFENEQAACEVFEQLIEDIENERKSKIVKRIINCK